MITFKVTYKGDPKGMSWTTDATSEKKAVEQVARQQGLNPKLLTAAKA